MNPAASAVANLLLAVLTTSPGVTGMSLRDCQFETSGLSAVYAVVRFPGGGELTNEQIRTLVRGADTSMLQALYWQNGGRTTEGVYVIDTAPSMRRVKCDTGCRYGVGIGVPVVCCAVLCIPIFISLVSVRRANLKLDPLPPPLPCAQVCCSRHAATLTPSYKLLNPHASLDPGYELQRHRYEQDLMRPDTPEFVPTVDEMDDGYPAGFQPPTVAGETDEERYTRTAHEAFEAERKRRDDENHWRRENGLPLLADMSTSKRKPRVIVVEDRKEAPYNTVMDLDPVERAKIEPVPPPPLPPPAAAATAPQPVSTSVPPMRDSDEVIVPQPMPSFYASNSSINSYQPNKKAARPESSLVGDRGSHTHPRHIPPTSLTPASITPSTLSPAVAGGAKRGEDVPERVPPNLNPDDLQPGVSPFTGANHQKVSLRDTGMIGGEILPRLQSTSPGADPDGRQPSILRPSSGKLSRRGSGDASTK
ncbi:hypothetical protein DQ04_02731010 [Trypanosoma grayi]|uniref:hypothetical protein n=1 Tax=Trypanosoma grayi TaxID=71804 RepID=UPI0004F4855E|nr:hypothetical protein DQ04_02731010 [Trypanosoma grayi]KEG11329.1 hypothetical protein DQ04_02731010 [Trypanosoma grayi]